MSDYSDLTWRTVTEQKFYALLAENQQLEQNLSFRNGEVDGLLAENQRLRDALEWLRRTHAQDTNRYIIEQIERELAGDAE